MARLIEQIERMRVFRVDDTALRIEHFTLQNCRSMGCRDDASQGDRFCGRCREELDGLYMFHGGRYYAVHV